MVWLGKLNFEIMYIRKEYSMKEKLEILIVEDEVILSAWLKIQLEDEGYFVYHNITTGEEAIEFIENTKPDVVLMDINLVGEMNGIEAAQIIKDKYGIPIIFMTGYEEDTVIDKANKVKPIAFITKPVEIWDLKPVLESL